jgi:hypothetical protein
VHGLHYGIGGFTMIAGCQTHSVDIAGGDTAILTLATIDDVNNNGHGARTELSFVGQRLEDIGGRRIEGLFQPNPDDHRHPPPIQDR